MRRVATSASGPTAIVMIGSGRAVEVSLRNRPSSWARWIPAWSVLAPSVSSTTEFTNAGSQPDRTFSYAAMVVL